MSDHDGFFTLSPGVHVFGYEDNETLKGMPRQVRVAYDFVKFIIQSRRSPVIGAVGGFDPKVDFAQPIDLSSTESAAYNAALQVLRQYFYSGIKTEGEPTGEKEVKANCPSCGTGIMRKRLREGKTQWTLACECGFELEPVKK